MNESSITIRWDKNPDDYTEITVNGDIDGQTHFREAFLSLDRLPTLHDITERETSGGGAGNLAAIALLTELLTVIRKSDKASGNVVSEQERNSKFPFTDLVTIRKFAEIAGIDFNERKFRNRREFRRYFKSLLSQE